MNKFNEFYNIYMELNNNTYNQELYPIEIVESESLKYNILEIIFDYIDDNCSYLYFFFLLFFFFFCTIIMC